MQSIHVRKMNNDPQITASFDHPRHSFVEDSEAWRDIEKYFRAKWDERSNAVHMTA